MELKPNHKDNPNERAPQPADQRDLNPTIESLRPELRVNKPKLESITPADIKPIIPKKGESAIVLGINASDRGNRKLSPDSPEFGTLDEGQAEATEAQYKEFFGGIFKDIPPDERNKVDILVIASSANLRMPGGINNPHQRSVETAKHIIAGAKASMAEFGVNSNQLLNKTDNPFEITDSRLVDLTMWENSPKYVQFLVDKYGKDSKELWVAFEEDRHKDIREQMGAEGPNDIADRVADYMATLDHALKLYHIKHPDRRVVAVVNGQYDSVAPTIKKFVTEQPMEDYLQIEKRGGIVLKVNEDGKMSTNIQGHEYPVKFPKSTTPEEILEKEQKYFRLPESERLTSEQMLEKLRNEPLDLEYVKEVVEKYAESERKRKHKNGQIIFAYSGTGKSFTVRGEEPDGEGITDLVDADFLYRLTGAHPLLPTKPGDPLRTHPFWYMNDEVIQEVEKRCGQVNEAMVEAGLWALTSSFDPEDSYVPSNLIAALIPPTELERNIYTKFDRVFYDGGVRATHDGYAISESHRKYIEQLTRKKDITVVDSIDKAVELARTREKE